MDCTKEEVRDFVVKLSAFGNAAMQLLEAFDKVNGEPFSSAGYPFRESFDEVALNIITWRQSAQDTANAEGLL